MRALRTTLTSPLFLKATSLVIGFLLWSTVNHLFTYSTWVTVPICFYNVDAKHIDAPESMNIELTGKRAHIRHINTDALAVHLDASLLSYGTHKCTISEKDLLLPPTISATTVIPHHLIITITRGAS